MDITSDSDHPLWPNLTFEPSPNVTFPASAAHEATVRPLATSLSKGNLHDHLTTFTSFYTRYYKSSTGKDSAEWLYKQVNSTITASGAVEYGANVRIFEHEWGQPSIIATIPGRSNKTIVIGAHQDSINLFLPSLLPAPGADDDGSGTVTILEAMRVLLTSDEVAHGRSTNTIEFHWYSAEEGGLLGSQALFAEYRRQEREIQAMFQQDMTGYVAGTLKAGHEESIGVINDFVDPGLTEFIKVLISTVRRSYHLLSWSDHKASTPIVLPSLFPHLLECYLLTTRTVLQYSLHLYHLRLCVLRPRFGPQVWISFRVCHRV